MLQSVKIKLNSIHQRKPRSLWQDSPCSYNYVSNSIRIDLKTPRFEIGSIYYRDEVNKQKKVFNEFEKPDLLLNQFRRQIQQVSGPKQLQPDDKSKQKNPIKKSYKSRSLSMNLSKSSHLYKIPLQTGFVYDRNGFRTGLIGQYSVKQIQARVRQNRGNFSFGRRLDLSRPLNFHPGAGSYDGDKSTSMAMTQRSISKMARTTNQFFRRHKVSRTPQPQITYESEIKGKRKR